MQTNTISYQPGLYKVVSSKPCNIRKEPRIVDSPVSNVVGSHTPGTVVEVFDIYVDKDMQPWGRVSQIDANGKAYWMCIETINGKKLQPIVPPSTTTSGGKILKLTLGDVVLFQTEIK